MVYIYGGQIKLWKLVFSFHQVDSGDQNHDVFLGGWLCLYLLSHLAASIINALKLIYKENHTTF